jgi:hypothetical protein
MVLLVAGAAHGYKVGLIKHLAALKNLSHMMHHAGRRAALDTHRMLPKIRRAKLVPGVAVCRPRRMPLGKWLVLGAKSGAIDLIAVAVELTTWDWRPLRHPSESPPASI